MPYYAVARGRETGIFPSWDECNTQINGFSAAKYKKFDTKQEAKEFLKGIVLSNSIEEKSYELGTNAFSVLMKTAKETVKEPELLFEPDYYVYTDGACSNNGMPDAKAGIGIYFGKDDACNLSEPVEGKQSNNTAELWAIIRTYDIIEDSILEGNKICIMSDSRYAIQAATTYGEKQSKENWNYDIPNKELVKKVYMLYKDKPNVRFQWIAAHTGKSDIHSLGNEAADKLANQAIGLESCPYDKKQTTNTLSSSKIYLNVPFTKKEEAKKLGARWDMEVKKWFVLESSLAKDKLLAAYGTT
jgi:ribonuclease HI